MRLSFAILAPVALGMMGCSGGGNGAPTARLDCAWLAGNNCWKTTLSEAESCLPPKGETGTLSADMTSCTYASGAVVTFDTALVLPLPDDPVWSFTVTSGGQQCLRLHDTSDGFTVTVDGQTVIVAAQGLTLVVSCPDQTIFSTSNALDLLSCPSNGSPLGSFPGQSWSDTPTSVSFGLVGAANASANIFSCRTP
jgi:hypothetical protein